MSNTVTQTPASALLNAVYKNVKMAGDSLINLMPKVKDAALRNDLTVALSVYEGFASRASKLLAEEGGKPEREGLMTKITAKMGVMMNTVRDSGTKHLAEMVIDEATMRMNDLLRQIREAEGRGVSGEPLHLAQHLCDFEKKTAEDMRAYLR